MSSEADIDEFFSGSLKWVGFCRSLPFGLIPRLALPDVPGLGCFHRPHDQGDFGRGSSLPSS